MKLRQHDYLKWLINTASLIALPRKRKLLSVAGLPVIKIGTADLMLTTDASGPLGQLIGGSSTGFPLVQQFNTFDNAHMRVSVVP